MRYTLTIHIAEMGAALFARLGTEVCILLVQASERCPQCEAAFGSVQQLIQHVDVVHCQGNAAHGGSQDTCPHCGKLFPDAVALVQHVERSHSNETQCVLS